MSSLETMGVQSRSDWSRIPLLQTTRSSSGPNVPFACTRCSVAPNGFRRLGVTGLAERDWSHAAAGNLDLVDDWPGQDSPDGELHARAIALLYSSADCRFRKWEDVVLDSLACHYEDHPVKRRNESDITAVELAALHHELAVDPLCSFSDLAADMHRYFSDATHQQS